MGKRILTLYVQDEDVILAKSKGMNISALFREFLKLELYGDDIEKKTKDEEIKTLQIKLAKLTNELEDERKRREKAEFDKRYVKLDM